MRPPPLPPPDEPVLAEGARDVVAVCRAELAAGADPVRSARLHYEIGAALADESEAIKHYLRALELMPEHLPSLYAARRHFLARRNIKAALPLYDTEIRLAARAEDRARLVHAKGRALEDVGRDIESARRCYRRAAEIVPDHPRYLEALRQTDTRERDFAAVAEAREREADAVGGDPALRAALLVKRARIVEARLERIPEAIELYQRALDLDPAAGGALAALKRLLCRSGRWRELCAVLEREADGATDPEIRAGALYRIGRVCSEQLGSRHEAIEALVRAMGVSRDRLVLQTLARMYEQAGEHEHLAHVLGHEVECVAEDVEKVALLHRVGEIYDDKLDRPDEARRWYEGALAIDPAFAPAIAALERIYHTAEAYQPLVGMYLAAAEACREPARRAYFHAHVAELFEERHGRPDEAMRHHALALGLDCHAEGSFKSLARLYAQHGRYRELCELHRGAVDRAADDPDVAVASLFRMGAVYEDHLGEPLHAMATYQAILDRAPTSLGALHALQRAAEAAARYTELCAALEREAELSNATARVVALLHRAAELHAWQIGDRAAALARFHRIVTELDPAHAPTLASLGRLYHELGRHEDALAIHEKELAVVDAGAPRAALLVRMGRICEAELGQPDEAVGYYRRAVAADPGYGPAIRALSQRLQAKEDFRGLASALQSEIVGQQSPHARARTAYRLGEVYETRLGKLDKAVIAYEQAVGHSPGFRPAVDALCRTHAALGHWPALVAALDAEAGVVRDPRLAVEAMLGAGEILDDRLDRPADAITRYQAVLEVDPENIAALLALEPLYRAAARWEPLAGLYHTLSQVLADGCARLVALEELCRLQELGVARTEGLGETYGAILAMDGGHRGALEGLARLALATGNAPLLADVDARIARAVEEPTLRAVHYARLGRSLEAESPSSALAAYRSALEHDPEHVAAMRGLGRAAEVAGDHRALAEALEREGRWTHAGARSAELLVRSAGLWRDRIGDGARARELAELALERDPDSAEGAELLVGLYGGAETERLIATLSQAAERGSRRRSAGLWCQVARLYANDLDDVGAGIAALERVTAEHGDELESARMLGDLYTRAGRWGEAAEAYSRALGLGPHGAARADIELCRGRLYAEHLARPRDATQSFEAVLVVEPLQREALAALFGLYRAAGQLDAAGLVAERLVTSAATVTERAAALCRLGRVELDGGRRTSAARTLHRAVVLEGPLGEAAAEYKRLLGDDEPWERYAEALAEHIRKIDGGELGGATAKPSYLALARIQHEVLTLVDESLQTLRRGLAALGGDLDVHLELCERLATAGMTDAAVTEYARVVTLDPSAPRPWRGMAQALHAAGRAAEAAVPCGPLLVLGAATDAEQVLAAERRVHRGWATPSSFSAAALSSISAAPDAWEEQRLVTLLASLDEALGKLYPLDLDAYGVSPRERIALDGDHPLAAECRRLAQAFGVGGLDLYIHRSHTGDVVAELGEPPALMVPRFVLELDDAERCFLLARAVASVARRVHAVPTLGRRETARVVSAALRYVAPDHGAERYPEDELVALHKRLHRALSRRARKNVEVAAAQCLGSPTVDFERWSSSVDRSLTRAAALIVNDLPRVVELLGRQTGDGRLAGVDLVRHSAQIGDLLRFWPEAGAFALRRAAGIL